jgi:hypothetical protein
MYANKKPREAVDFERSKFTPLCIYRMSHGEDVFEQMKQSAWGFRNIKAKTRIERKTAKDKVALERSRLMARSGWQARIHQKNCPETTAQLTQCKPGDEGFLSDSERFHSDVAGEEFRLRADKYRKANEAQIFKRERARVRDEERWAANEKLQNLEEAKLQRMRENPNIDAYRTAKKNQSNVAYDITNLQYKQDTTGEAQRYYDNMVRYRAQARTRALVVLGDSRVPYNILNGEQRSLPPKPNSVDKPECVDNPELLGKISDAVDRRKADGAELNL